MKELTLYELKETTFNLLKVFDAFAKENNITYFLAYGTLLGAIRYKKFIPWDDDVDLLIPREDYDRMVKIYKDNDRYKMFSFERDSRYRFPFAKLCDMNTRKVENLVDNGLELGVDIDLFPLDKWDNDFKKAKKEASYIGRNMYHMSLSKLTDSGSTKLINKIVKPVVIFFCKKKGYKYYIQNIIRQTTCVKGESQYVGCKVWCVYGIKCINPAEAFEKAIEVEFEGEFFPAPIGYDQYLTCLYGDYLPEPPKEKQKTHHSFKAYKL